MTNFEYMGIMPYTIDNPRGRSFLWLPLGLSSGIAEIQALEAIAQDLLATANKRRTALGINGQLPLPMPAMYSPAGPPAGFQFTPPVPTAPPPAPPTGVYGQAPGQYVPPALQGLPVPDPKATSPGGTDPTYEEFIAWRNSQQPHQYAEGVAPAPAEPEWNPMVGGMPGYAPPPGSRIPEPINPEARKPTKQ
jgi:hypothetical protein